MGLGVEESDIYWLRERISTGGISRSRLSAKLCERKGWRDGKGRLRTMAARVLRGRLNRKSVITLPPAVRVVPSYQRRSSLMQEEALPVQSSPELIGSWSPPEVTLTLADSAKERRIWREMMDQHHYLGSGPLCGAQLKYLVYVKGCAVGGLAFSSAAYALGARDNWIGWSKAARKLNLNRVICNSRFLVTCKLPNLASHVLSAVSARLASDWDSRYGVRPLLVETFVEKDRYAGTCYKAANWHHVGETTGRGRNDTGHNQSASIKHIFLFPLAHSWQEALCREPVKELSHEQSWAALEFGSIDLGDARLTERVMTIAEDFFAKPTANIPQACGSRAKTKALYRLCSTPTATMDTLRSGHTETTLARCAKESRVFAIQDTTTLNYTTHAMTDGLGPIGSFGAQATLGLLLHSTFMLSEADTPLGLLNAQCWTRSADVTSYGKADERYDLPIEDKESYKWVKGFNAVVKAAHRAPNTEFVVMGDREADIFELFEAHRTQAPKNVELLVRACHPRKISLDSGNRGTLWEHVQSQPSRGEMVIRTPRRGSRAARDARVEMRCAEVQVVAPDKPSTKQYRPVRLYAIIAQEVCAPEGVEPIRWLLLYTAAVNTFEAAVEKVVWYTKRWHMEVFHRTLKSGCRIENRQLGSAHSLQAALSIDLAVAWLIFHLAKLGREVPDAPCTVFFEDCEWKALMCFVGKTPIPPDTPPTLKEALIHVATLGGFLGRKRDGMVTAPNSSSSRAP